MSADDFQTKYASVMESMLRSAVAETTKLFETMVDELKAEISKMKQENEDLKRRCSQFESARGQTTDPSQDSEPVPRQTDDSDKRDEAVQCDLAPTNILEEQSEPSSPSPQQNQDQQCENIAVQHVWQEHNYEFRGKRHFRKALLQEKQGTVDSPQQSGLRIEEAESISRVSSNKECTKAEKPTSQRKEEAEVAPERSSLRVQRDIPTAHNQSSEPESSQHTSQASEPAPSNKGKASDECESNVSKDEASCQSFPHIIPKRGRPSKKVLLEQVKQIPPPSSEVKKTVKKTPKRTRKNIDSSAAVDAVSTVSPKATKGSPVQSKRSSPRENTYSKDVGNRRVGSSRRGQRSSENEKPAEHSELSMDVDRTNEASSTDVLPAVEKQKTLNTHRNKSPRAPADQTRERLTSATLQDALLLVEAMNQSTEENTPFPPQASSVTTKSVQTVVEIETQRATGDKPLTKLSTATQLRQKEQKSDHQTIKKVHVEPERQTSLAKTQEAAGDKPLTQLSTTARVTKKKQNSGIQTVDATGTDEALSCKQVDIPKQEDTVPLSNTSDTSGATSTTATQTIMKSLQPRLSVYQMKPVIQSKQGDMVTQKIIVMSSLVASAIPHKSPAQSPAQPPTVTSTHVEAQKSEPPSLTSKNVPLEKSVSPQKPIPAATSKSSASPAESKSGSLIHPKITIIVPRQVPAAARKPSQTVAVSAMQEANSSDAVKSPSSQPKSSSQELSTSGDTETTTGEMAPILSTKHTSDNSECSKQTASSSDLMDKPSEMSCSSNTSLVHEPTSVSPVVPLTADQKMSVFVRLTRLQYPKSPNDTIVLSSRPTEWPPVIKPLPTEDATVDETLFGVEQTQPSETQVLYSDISDTEETSSTKSSSKEAATKKIPSHVVIQTSDTQVEYSDISSDSEANSETKSPSKDGATEKKPLPVVKPTQSLETQGTYSDISDSEETSVHASLKRPPMLEKQKAAQKKASSSGKLICLEDSTTPSTVPAPICAKSTTEINSSEPSDMADESTFSTLEKEMVSTPEQDSELPNDPPIEQDSPTTEKVSPAVVHRMTIDVKDMCDPHLQMTKTQFLAQLAVSPIVQGSEKTSTNDSEDANTRSPKTSTAFQKELQKKEFVAKFRRHLKTHMQGGSLERNGEPCTKTETLTRGSIQPTLDQEGPSEKSTSIKTIPLNPRLRGTALDSVSKKTANDPAPVSARGSETSTDTCTETETLTKSCKKARIEKDSLVDNSLTVKLTRVNPKKQGSDVATASEKTTDVPTPISRRSGTSTDGVRSKKSVNNLASATPTRSKATAEFTPGIPKRSRSGGDTASKEKLLSPESARRSSSAIESAVAKKSKKASDIPGVSGSMQQSGSPKNRKNTSVSPRGLGSTKDTACPRPTRNTSVSPNRSGAEKRKGSASPKRIKTPPVQLKRASSTRDGPSPKSNKTLNPTDTETPKWTRCTPPGTGASCLSKNSPSPKKPANDAVSMRNTKSGVNVQSAGGLKSAEDKTGETTPKRPKVVQEGSTPRQIIKVVNSKLSSKASKDKTDAKTKKSPTDQPGEANTSQSEENCADTENERRMSTSVVWTPPVLPKSKKALAGKSKVKKETDSPSEPVVYPPSVSLHPIPFRGPPVVSPLQPLSVIGWRLLKNQCGECGRVLSSSAALESHVSLHTGRRPFSCSLCGKGFPDSKGLKRHGRVHRNGRIHVCQQCGKGFVYSFGLTKHLQMVHGRIKPFVCQICNKGFFSKRDVEAHIRIHTGEKPFHCNLCEKKFARRTELNMHLRWHNGEKRHWCPYCGKGFLDVNNLKRHKYIHTGERPHACPHCPKTFTQSGHLKKHLKNVHKLL